MLDGGLEQIWQFAVDNHLLNFFCSCCKQIFLTFNFNVQFLGKELDAILYFSADIMVKVIIADNTKLIC